MTPAALHYSYVSTALFPDIKDEGKGRRIDVQLLLLERLPHIHEQHGFGVERLPSPHAEETGIAGVRRIGAAADPGKRLPLTKLSGATAGVDQNRLPQRPLQVQINV